MAEATRASLQQRTPASARARSAAGACMCPVSPECVQRLDRGVCADERKGVWSGINKACTYMERRGQAGSSRRSLDCCWRAGRGWTAGADGCAVHATSSASALGPVWCGWRRWRESWLRLLRVGAEERREVCGLQSDDAVLTPLLPRPPPCPPAGRCSGCLCLRGKTSWRRETGPMRPPPPPCPCHRAT